MRFIFKFICIMTFIAVVASGFISLYINISSYVASLRSPYDYAYIALPNGTSVEGYIDSLEDCYHNNKFRIEINGTTYLVDYSDVSLISY